MGSFQEETSREEEAIAAAAEKQTSRRQIPLFIIGGAIVTALSLFGVTVVRRINRNFRRALTKLFAAARETSSAAAKLLSASNEQVAELIP